MKSVLVSILLDQVLIAFVSCTQSLDVLVRSSVL